MARIDDILQRAFPGRETFADEERSFAEAIVSASMVHEHRHTALPTRFVEAGGYVRVAGHLYRCDLRPRETCPAAACLGCDFSRKYRICGDLQCSVMDRRDGNNVWFVEVGDGE